MLPSRTPRSTSPRPMALHPCFECGASVSTLAPSCPHCGAPDPAWTATPVQGPTETAGDPSTTTPAAPPAASTTAHPAVWYYLADDVRHGPHTRTEMLELLGRGAIAYGTRVRDDTMQFWLPLRAVPALTAGAATRPTAPDPRPRAPAEAPPRRASAAAEEERLRSVRSTATVVYALQAASFLVCLTVFAGAIVNYARLHYARGSWVGSHFVWQINTFWGHLAWWAAAVVLGIVSNSLGLFVVVYMPAMGWMLYRIVRGWLRLNDGRRIP